MSIEKQPEESNIESESIEDKDKEPFEHQETLHFSDDQLALVFRTSGDLIEWGKHKYANPHNSIDRIIIKTKSGNRYIIGDKVIINEREKLTWDIEDMQELPDITIGDNWVVPEAFSTTDIDSVLLRYKVGELDYAENVDEPNPFEELEPLIKRTREKFDENKNK